MKSFKIYKPITTFVIFIFLSVLSYTILINEKSKSTKKDLNSKVSVETQFKLRLFNVPGFNDQLNYFSEKLKTNSANSEVIRYVEENIYGYEEIYGSQDKEFIIYRETTEREKVDKFEKQLVTKHMAKFSSIIIDKYISFFDKELIKNYNLVRNLPESEKKNELIFKSIQMENLIKNLKSNHEDFISIKQYRVVIKNVNPNKLGYIREEYLEDRFEYKYLIITSILFGLICSVLFVFYFGKLIKRK